MAQRGVHILLVQTVMSPNNKYEQVNNFATSSIDPIDPPRKGISWRHPARPSQITIVNVMYLTQQFVQRVSRTLRALKKETDFKPCYVATAVKHLALLLRSYYLREKK